ncbi:hypothetical protein [[Mycobacterium] crassicus]|uniref:Uncharacterized protein n=1 Tax=[Mycobacterium] crassicus TaxID=2872309 RepID=A0ABU5XGB1_9MYCO|nr:hypothetical protein [Mycolicibacter sp. MYC098]MEB3021320.1 hypothetical protein [Mycolicibacter sp. MYC098]
MSDPVVFEIEVPDPVDVAITPGPVTEVEIQQPTVTEVIVAPVLPGSAPDPQAVADAVTNYLTTNPVLPPQAGKAGNVLSTDGADPSWMDITPPVTLTLLLDNALV